jgi:hypothetical protein
MAENEPDFAGRSRLVYHYTSMSGLKAIVESGRLRATHYDYLNDPDELVYCKKLWGDHLRIANPDDGDVPFFGEAYIVSFSELEDDLTLWRTYGDNGAGVSIGVPLDSEFIVPPVSPDAEWSRLKSPWGQVSYAEAEHGQLVQGMAFEKFRELAPTMKRAVHAFEREWRLITWTAAFIDYTPPVAFRPSKFGLTPSIDVAPVGDQLPIRSIVLGPATNPKAVYAVGLLLSTNGYHVEWLAQDWRDGCVAIRPSGLRVQ